MFETVERQRFGETNVLIRWHCLISYESHIYPEPAASQYIHPHKYIYTLLYNLQRDVEGFVGSGVNFGR